MIIARILQGIGLSMFPIAFGIIRLQFPKEKLSIAQGIFTGLFTSGSAIGLALGGTIIYHYGWHFALLSMIPAAIILILIIIKFIHIREEQEEKEKEKKQADICNNNKNPRSKIQSYGTEYCCVFTKIGNEKGEYFHPKINEEYNDALAESPTHDYKNNNNSSNILKKIDIKGAITLSATIISFLMALSFLENIHSSSSSTMADLLIPIFIFSIISIVSLMLFIVVERKLSTKVKSMKMPKTSLSFQAPPSSSMTGTESPLIDLNLLTNRIILLNNISLMIVGITMFMVYQSISVLSLKSSAIRF